MPLDFRRVQPALDHAAAGGVVVTSNTRASRFLRRAAAAQAREAGSAAWRPPDVLHWDAWVQRLWQDRVLAGEEDRIVLSPQQERIAWETLPELAGQERLCALAQSAWSLLWQYAGGPAALKPQSGTGEWLRFRQWAGQFEGLLQQNRWVTQSQLAELLARELNAAPQTRHGHAAAPEPVMLAAFDRLLPAQQHLRNALARHTSVVDYAPSYDRHAPPFAAGTAESTGTAAPPQAHAAKICFPDQSRAIEAAAWWARRRLEAAPEGQQPYLAVIAPSVNTVRGEIRRVFSRVLGPEAFQFSLGAPLASAPLASVALLLLRWLQGPLPLASITDVLLSRYAGQRGPEAMSLRAQLDVALRVDCKLALPEYSLLEFSLELDRRTTRQKSPFKPLGELAMQARRAARFAAELSQTATPQTAAAPEQTPSWWVEHFNEYLSIWQLSPPPETDARAYQSQKSWDSLLDTVASFDLTTQPRPLRWMLETLDRLARETVFQPAAADVPVEVLGPLEAAGSLFDGIFFLDAEQQSWPQGGNPHPLLPAELQLQTGMPHGSLADDFAAAEEVTHRLLRTTGEALFSWPAMDKTGRLHPSLLLEKLAPAPQDYVASLSIQREMFACADSLELDSEPSEWHDDRGTLRAAALEQQAACPFQSFAANRLDAGEIENPEDGPNARERGNLLHKLLQNIWWGTDDPVKLEGLRTLKRLNELRASGTLAAFVRTHAEALPRENGRGRWQDAFHSLELQRVTERVLEWLDTEAARSPFEVLSVETPVTFQLNNLTFSLKLDRIDELPGDGPEGRRVVLLDYKTGKVTDKILNSERKMEKPQLALYVHALTSGTATGEKGQPIGTHHVSGVAYGSLKVGHVQFCGFAEPAQPAVLPSIKPKDLQAREFPAWEGELDRLSREFFDGRSEVDPISRDVCQYCSFPSLCRVTEVDAIRARQDLELETRAGEQDGL